MPRALILADDLTGAADCAVQAVRRGLSASVALRPDAVGAADVVALDLDTRGGSAAAAREATRAAASGAPELLYVKLDSLLRGHLGAAIDGALDATGAELAIVAPAFPAQARKTAGGVQHAGGEPVGDVVARLRGQSERPVALGALAGEGLVVCDAEDEADLARIVAAALGRRVVWAGSAGLAAALFEVVAREGMAAGGGAAGGARAAAVGGGAAAAVAGEAAPAGRGVLVVSGTAAPAGLAQLDALLARPGSVAIDLAAPDPAATALARGDDVVLRGGSVAALAEAAAAAAGHAAGLVLTGGETARAVCDRVGVRSIELIGEVGPGVPLGRIGSRAVVTKAGAFGGPETLCRAVDAIRGARA